MLGAGSDEDARRAARVTSNNYTRCLANLLLLSRLEHARLHDRVVYHITPTAHHSKQSVTYTTHKADGVSSRLEHSSAPLPAT